MVADLVRKKVKINGSLTAIRFNLRSNQWCGGSTLAGGHSQFRRPLENFDCYLLYNVPWLFKGCSFYGQCFEIE